MRVATHFSCKIPMTPPENRQNSYDPRDSYTPLRINNAPSLSLCKTLTHLKRNQ